jgi:tetratricopeptide (TPR) repeat protein
MKPLKCILAWMVALAYAITVAPDHCAAQDLRIPTVLAPGFAKLADEGTRNAVLNYMQLGKDALQYGEWDLAAHCFDHALQGIEVVYANSEQAARARSLWHEEGAKTFKGEPYERAMAYWYRAVAYLQAGHLDNARACCESGLLQDAFAEEEQNRSDFALLAFMSAWCSQAIGNQGLADQSFEEARSLRPGIARPDIRSNVVILVETGTAPRKLADGVGHAELVFRRGRIWTDLSKNRKRPFEDVRVEISVDGRLYDEMVSESIYYQAATRGGRPLDRILEGQVKFKSTSAELGQVFMDMGCNYDTDAAMAMVGIGSVASLIALNAKPHADIRYWKNLPDAVHCLPVYLEAGRRLIEVRFLDKDGRVIAGMTQLRTVEILPDRRCHVVCVFGHEQVFSRGVLPQNDLER